MVDIPQREIVGECRRCGVVWYSGVSRWAFSPDGILCGACANLRMPDYIRRCYFVGGMCAAHGCMTTWRHDADPQVLATLGWLRIPRTRRQAAMWFCPIHKDILRRYFDWRRRNDTSFRSRSFSHGVALRLLRELPVCAEEQCNQWAWMAPTNAVPDPSAFPLCLTHQVAMGVQQLRRKKVRKKLAKYSNERFGVVIADLLEEEEEHGREDRE